jgi:transposase
LLVKYLMLYLRMEKQHLSHHQDTAQLTAKISALEAALLEKEAVISEKDSVIQKLTQDIEYLAFHNDQMRRLIHGSKSERFIPQVHYSQLTLTFEEIADICKAVKEEQEKIRIEYQRRRVKKEHPGRMFQFRFLTLPPDGAKHCHPFVTSA